MADSRRPLKEKDSARLFHTSKAGSLDNLPYGFGNLDSASPTLAAIFFSIFGLLLLMLSVLVWKVWNLRRAVVPMQDEEKEVIEEADQGAVQPGKGTPKVEPAVVKAAKI